MPWKKLVPLILLHLFRHFLYTRLLSHWHPSSHTFVTITLLFSNYNNIAIRFDVAKEGTHRMVQPPAWRQEHLHLQHRLVGHRLPLPINFAQLPLQNSRSVKIVPQTQKWIRNPSKLQTLGVMLRQAWLEKARPRKIQQKEIERLSLPSSNPAENTQFPQHKG